jgi:hypothetical protein
LGLAALHLFTGAMPYEEVMEEVTCPPELVDALAGVWVRGGNNGYSALRRVLTSDLEDLTLYHTFYRFLVLLGMPPPGAVEADNPVWAAVRGLITTDQPANAVRGWL